MRNQYFNAGNGGVIPESRLVGTTYPSPIILDNMAAHITHEEVLHECGIRNIYIEQDAGNAYATPVEGSFNVDPDGEADIDVDGTDIDSEGGADGKSDLDSDLDPDIDAGVITGSDIDSDDDIDSVGTDVDSGSTVEVTGDDADADIKVIDTAQSVADVAGTKEEVAEALAAKTPVKRPGRRSPSASNA